LNFQRSPTKQSAEINKRKGTSKIVRRTTVTTNHATSKQASKQERNIFSSKTALANPIQRSTVRVPLPARIKNKNKINVHNRFPVVVVVVVVVVVHA
jgi:hypothetical protein